MHSVWGAFFLSLHSMFLLKNITVAFNGKIIFESFNMQLNKGDKLLITAPSGSGKTSFLKILLGFIQAEKGSVLFQNKEVTPETVKKLRQQVSYLSQDIDFPNGIVNPVLNEIFTYATNKNRKITREAVLKQMKELNLDENILIKKMNELSGGERQRLGWVVLKLLDRPILLLDEPTSALDKELKQKLIDYIAQCDKTCVVVSHDQEWQKHGFKTLSSFAYES